MSTDDHVRRAAHDLLVELNRVEAFLAAGNDEEAGYAQLKRALDNCLTELRTTNLLGRANEIPSSILWNVAGHLLERGWLQERARAKPRGYPGDSEMLARFYHRTLSGDPLGRLFDRYFQDQPAPRAVESRMRMMTDWVVEAVTASRTSITKIAIVGSAFGLEIHDALVRLPEGQREKIRVTLVDLDPLALDTARTLLGPLLPAAHFIAANTNPLRLLKRPQLAEVLAGSDLIFCPGVCDYLTDAEATSLLQILYGQLAPCGRLTVFQFAPHDPTRAYMEWIGNWYLTYRDSSEFQSCVQRANLPAANVTYGPEPLGVDLFVTVVRP